MEFDADLSLLADDAYKTWKRRVRQATLSVRVFTPYLDAMLVRLLGNAAVGEESLSVVTDLSPMGGALDYRGQLIGVRALLRKGIEVRSLPRLHAKVLVCDGRNVTLGSQNFTTYARSSKETTAVVGTDSSASTFIQTLDEWYEQALPVDLQFIEELLETLQSPTSELLKALQELNGSFEELWSAFLQRLEDERRAKAAASRHQSMAVRLARARRRSVDRLAGSEVLTSLEWVEYGYVTLRAQDADATLTDWLRCDESGWSNTELERLYFYPIILNPSGRMGFVRVTQTRFTYVRTHVRRTNPQELLGQQCWLEVRFPTENLESSNIHVYVSVDHQKPFAQLELRIRFDGAAATLTAWHLAEPTSSHAGTATMLPSESAQLRELAEGLEEHGLEELLQSALHRFRFSELGVDNHNAAKFFPEAWIRITLLDYPHTPVLMATPL